MKEMSWPQMHASEYTYIHWNKVIPLNETKFKRDNKFFLAHVSEGRMHLKTENKRQEKATTESIFDIIFEERNQF